MRIETPPSATASVELRGVHKRFGAQHVIRGVDLQIEAGEFCVFVGPSGCGKSTLLRLLAGLEDASAGQLLIGGRDVTGLPPKERGVAMVFQSYALYPHMTVYRNIAFGLETGRRQRAETDRRVREVAQLLELTPLLDRLPKELSGGQRQRVAIARAIVREPQVFLFDEPLSNLDATLRVQTRIEIARLHRRIGATMVYVTHDQVEAMTLADKIVVLNGGKVEQVGAPLQLYHQPRNQFVAGFIGAQRMNFIPCRVLAAGAAGVAVELPGQESLTVPVDAAGITTGQPLTLGVRPEHMRGDGGDASLTGLVEAVEELGEGHLLYLRSADGTLVSGHFSGASGCREGDLTRFAFYEDACHLFDGDGVALPRLARG